MEPWRRELIEQFPELRHSPESWPLVDAAAKLGGRVEKATTDALFSFAARHLLAREQHAGVDAKRHSEVLRENMPSALR